MYQICRDKIWYGNLDNVPLPAFAPLKIGDIILLFQLISSLFSRVAESTTYSETVSDIDTMFSHPYKIEAALLKKYLLERTSYDPGVIDVFLGMTTKPQEDYYNFWNRPFAAIGNDLLVPLLPITAANHFHLLDRWLERGGYNLEKRGKLLEEYVKKTLSETLSIKAFEHNIPKLNVIVLVEKQKKSI